jgi:hypothetical protein
MDDFDFDSGSSDYHSGDSNPHDSIPLSNRQMEWAQTLSVAKLAQLKMEERRRAAGYRSAPGAKSLGSDMLIVTGLFVLLVIFSLSIVAIFSPSEPMPYTSNPPCGKPVLASIGIRPPTKTKKLCANL